MVLEQLATAKLSYCTDSYAERNSNQYNRSEAIFEIFCQNKGWKAHRMGFDEKNSNIDFFFRLNPMIRSLPDYVVTTKSQIYYCHVKGTNKLKLNDLMLYSKFEELYCTEQSKLLVAFCFMGTVKFRTLKSLRDEIAGLKAKKFENDGKLYFEIKI